MGARGRGHHVLMVGEPPEISASQPGAASTPTPGTLDWTLTLQLSCGGWAENCRAIAGGLK
jgi:hypothetical protein